MSQTRPTQIALAEREAALAAGRTTEEGLAAIRADRKARWAPIVAAMFKSAALKNWAAAMTMKHGPTILVHGLELDWITALLVQRYGEAEYHWGHQERDADGETVSHVWPPVLSDDDIKRAGELFEGKKWPTHFEFPPPPPLTAEEEKALETARIESLKAELAALTGEG